MDDDLSMSSLELSGEGNPDMEDGMRLRPQYSKSIATAIRAAVLESRERILDEDPAGPEVRVNLVPPRLERGGQAAVDDQGAGGKGLVMSSASFQGSGPFRCQIRR